MVCAVSVIEHGEVSEGRVVDYHAVDFSMEFSIVEDAEDACHRGRELEVIEVVLGHCELGDIWFWFKWIGVWLLWF